MVPSQVITNYIYRNKTKIDRMQGADTNALEEKVSLGKGVS